MIKRKSSSRKKLQRIPWRRRVLYGLVLYFAFGTACDKAWTALNPSMERIGAACFKPYLPSCLEPSVISLFPRAENQRFTTNSLGYPGPEIGHKSQDVIRVVFLGGSTTFFPVGNAYPDALAHRLRSLDPTLTLEFINAALPGYGLAEIREQLQREFSHLEVDIAVVSEPWNFSAARLIHGAPDEPRSPFVQLVGQLPLASLVTRIVTTARAANAMSDIKDLDLDSELRAYRETIEEIHETCRASGIQLVLGVHPDGWPLHPDFTDSKASSKADIGDRVVRVLYPKQRLEMKRMIDQFVREYANLEGLPLIDWEGAFKTDLEPSILRVQFQKDRVHLTHDGAQLLGTIGADELLSLLHGATTNVN